MDCLKVAELIGLKSMLNEFVAYERLGVLIAARTKWESRDIAVPPEYAPDGGITIQLLNGTKELLPYGVLFVRHFDLLNQGRKIFASHLFKSIFRNEF